MQSDVDLIAAEMELDKAVAERTLREHKGDVVQALNTFITLGLGENAAHPIARHLHAWPWSRVRGVVWWEPPPKCPVTRPLDEQRNQQPDGTCSATAPPERGVLGLGTG